MEQKNVNFYIPTITFFLFLKKSSTNHFLVNVFFVRPRYVVSGNHRVLYNSSFFFHFLKNFTDMSIKNIILIWKTLVLGKEKQVLTKNGIHDKFYID